MYYTSLPTVHSYQHLSLIYGSFTHISKWLKSMYYALNMWKAEVTDISLTSFTNSLPYT
jgi:hypothetical protein